MAARVSIISGDCFEEKFDPVWQPRFQAASGTIGPFIARADVAALAIPFPGSLGR
jgi:lysylphosphatidylglycerol synthetase-like protein (DUF2156 family)